MYRISAYIVRNTALLMRRVNPVELRIASFSRSPVSQAWYNRVRERDPCPPKPPKPLKPYKFNFYFISSGILLALTAGFIVYAKSNPEVRDWLTINMPWFDDLIAVLYEENVPLSEGMAEYLVYFRELFDNYTKELPEECLQTPPPVNVALKTPIAGETCEEDDDDEDEDEEDEKEDELACIVVEPPVKTTDVCKFEECLKETAEEIVNNYMTARDYCLYYNKLVVGTMMNFSIPKIKFLKSQQEEREEIIEEYVNVKNEDAETRFNNLVIHMKCGIEAPQDRLEAVRKKAEDFKDIIVINKGEFEIAYEEALQRDKQWKMVDCLLDVFVVEVKALYPEVDFMADQPTIHGDFDHLLMHTKKYVDKLRLEMDEMVYGMSSKVTRAYDGLPVPPGKEKDHQAKLEAAYKKAKADMDKEFADRLTQMKKDGEDDLKKKLAIQKQMLDERFEGEYQAKKEQLEERSERLIAERVGNEKMKLDAELERMQIELRLVEEKLEERMKAERETRRAAQLYAASASLLSATAKGDPRIKVNKELEIIRKNSTDDTLVETVLNAIPQDVKDKGLVPESIIRERYYSMEDIAMKVAMVDRAGGPLPLYAFSWLQSKLLFMKPSTVPQVELDDPPVEPFEQFDTFDLLQRARYFMSKGNLAKAVRYVDALEGASRGAAEDWYQNANALLQTRQAAQAILAHAAAISLKYM